MTGLPKERWDYWDNKCHDAAHEERTGCFGPFLLMIIGCLLFAPLGGIAVDFYEQMLCRYHFESWCGTKLIDWSMSVARNKEHEK